MSQKNSINQKILIMNSYQNRLIVEFRIRNSFLFFSIIEKGEENCGDLIEEHKACMRKMGFNI